MIPSQADADKGDPRQHAVWALRNLPMVAGVGAITNPMYLADWSEHLWKVGFRHVDALRELADEDGNIHISKLPEQKIKFQPAFRGQRHDMNHAARWVGINENDDPEPVVIPDITKLTQQENAAMLQQYRKAGMIKDHRDGPSLAEEYS